MRIAISVFLIFCARPAFPADEDDWGAPPTAPVSAPATRGVSSETARRTQLLKLRGNGLYQAGRYREACRAYAECARLDSMDASARVDLAGCYRKLGRKDSALACAREALRLADAGLAASDTVSWSFSDLRVRKSAYFLLDEVGAPMPTPKPGQCETWTASGDAGPGAGGACLARLHVCAERGSRPDAGGTLRWDVLRAGVTGLGALFTYDEVEPPSQVPHPELRDMEAMSIDGISESESRWVNRDSSATLPLGEFLEAADPACSGPACGAIEKETAACRILHFDACAGVIGMACAYQEEGGPDQVVVGEWYLVPAR